MLHGRGFTLDIWLKSAKPSALLKDPLPKGSKVPKGPASSTNSGRVNYRASMERASGGRGKCCLPVVNGPQRGTFEEVAFACQGCTSGCGPSTRPPCPQPTLAHGWCSSAQASLAMTAASGRATGTVLHICTSSQHCSQSAKE